MFVCLEGPDGCGKSSHALKLQKHLNASLMKFPNKNSLSGRLIYENLEGKWYASSGMQNGEYEAIPLSQQVPEVPGKIRDALIFQALQSLNRLEFVEEIDRQAISGNIVMDRYWPSAYAYGKADGLDGEYLIKIHEILPQPDLFILLDIDIDDSYKRRPERRDRYEANAEFMTNVMLNYRELWTLPARRSFLSAFETVNARGTPAETEKAILDCVNEHMERNNL